MAAPTRVTVLTPEGQVVSGVTTQRPRPGAVVTIVVGSGTNSRQVRGRVVGSGQGGPSRRGERSSVFGAGPALTTTTLLPESGEVRFLDAIVTVVVSAVTVVWTATRKGTSALGWAVFWMLLGSLMFVEGRGELAFGGAGVSAANAAYLALRIAGLVQANPTAAYAQARRIQTAYQRGDLAEVRYFGGLVMSRVA